MTEKIDQFKLQLNDLSQKTLEKQISHLKPQVSEQLTYTKYTPKDTPKGTTYFPLASQSTMRSFGTGHT